MKKILLVTLSVMLLSAFFAGSASQATAKESKILEFDTMAGVPATLTGTQASAMFRGVNAGGRAWSLTSAHGELKASGQLEIQVQGLVLTDTNSNPSAFFGVTVSCITSAGTVANIPAGNFTATTGAASLGGGNANIETSVALPQPCFAPIVFVTGTQSTANPNGSWFAVTGN